MSEHPEIALARRNAELRCREAASEIPVYLKGYIDGYEFRGDRGDHTPTEAERVLLDDAINGLIADEEFLRKLREWEKQRRLLASLPPDPKEEGSRSITGTGETGE